MSFVSFIFPKCVYVYGMKSVVTCVKCVLLTLVYLLINMLKRR